ncbi:MAG: DNA-3-methyladenine glycosylase I [Spirochaetales bacterium]|nr:DNA-3-methyladenine glycosylase I [Spirochaetales bacterium]
MSESTATLPGYCGWVATRPPDDPNRAYHDREYGFPIRDERGLFRLLVLEINQAGLSWSTVLNKRAAFDRAYEGFDIERIAAYGSADVERLMADAGIIRNRRKIDAAIENARRLLALRPAYPSFGAWLDAHHPRPKDEWVKTFKRTFVFTGGEITGEFLMSSGYIDGAHVPGCPVRERAVAAGAAWARATSPA